MTVVTFFLIDQWMKDYQDALIRCVEVVVSVLDDQTNSLVYVKVFLSLNMVCIIPLHVIHKTYLSHQNVFMQLYCS